MGGRDVFAGGEGVYVSSIPIPIPVPSPNPLSKSESESEAGDDVVDSNLSSTSCTKDDGTPLCGRCRSGSSANDTFLANGALINFPRHRQHRRPDINRRGFS